MKLNSLFLICGLLASSLFASVAAEGKEPLKYVDALSFRMINKGFKDTETPFTRLPKSLKDSVRPNLWNRSECSSGLGIRFATNSKRVGVRYTLLWNAHMNHMADTGIKGSDLYILNDAGLWEYVNSARPNPDKDKKVEQVFVENLDGKMHEYLIYLPLYDGVTSMDVAVDKSAEIKLPEVDSPRKDKKVVIYGTSILQGGCSSRTGSMGTNILQRALDCEVVNLGFSGEGKMDYCIARAIASIEDADVFVLDAVPNCTKDMCDSLTYDFVKIIKTKRPDLPIVMVEGPMFSYAKFDSFTRDYLPSKNAAYRKNYERLVADGYKGLYYVTCEGLSGYDNEGTVDGIHFTDVGYRYYADKLTPVLRQLLW